MTSIASTPGALRLFALSIVARLPMPMLGLGLLVHAEHLTDSFTAAGLVSGAFAVSVGIGGPLLGKLVDRRGQTAALLGSALVAATVLATLAMAPAGTPVSTLAGLAIAIGLATPPIGACLRTLLPGLLPDQGSLRAAYAVEATAVELTWVAGPPLALGLGALWSTGTALLVAGIVLIVATVAFAIQPASRSWRPAATTVRSRGGALRTPAMRTLVIALAAAGTLFGGVEVAVTASTEALGSTAAAGPLLGIWGVGSLIGGIVATRLGGGAHTAGGLSLILGALTVGHLLLVPASGSLVALTAVLLVAGAAIAPTFASAYAMVEDATPSGTVTEAFAWLATALAIGNSVGAAVAGAIADHAGPDAAFAFAGVAGGVALLVMVLRSCTLARPAAAAV